MPNISCNKLINFLTIYNNACPLLSNLLPNETVMIDETKIDLMGKNVLNSQAGCLQVKLVFNLFSQDNCRQINVRFFMKKD